MNCRCSQVATKKCFLCEAELCAFHTGAKPVMTAIAEGVTRIRHESVCFPDCTSLFGTRDDIEKPVAQA